MRCRTLAIVPISDPSPDEIRRTVAYRAALWCIRIAYAGGLVGVVLWLVSRSVIVFVVGGTVGASLAIVVLGFAIPVGCALRAPRYPLVPGPGSQPEPPPRPVVAASPLAASPVAGRVGST